MRYWWNSNSLFIHVHDFHVHRVYGGEHIGGALHHAFAGLGHRDWRTGGEEDGFVAAAEWQVREVVALD